MHSSASVTIIQRRLGWEVAINGSTRPLIDWYFSEERALEAAQAHADELGLDVVGRVLHDGTVDSWIRNDGSRFSRYSQAG